MPESLSIKFLKGRIWKDKANLFKGSQ